MTIIGGNHSDQNHFRFYNDGTESGSTALAAEDTNIFIQSQNFLTVYQIRIGQSWSSCMCATLSRTRQFSYSLNGAAFNNITTSSSVIKSVTGTTADNTNTTNRLTNPGGFTFTAGKVTTTGLTNSKTFNAGQCWEDVCPFNIISADVKNGDTIDIRITGLTNYNITPRITIVKSTGFFLLMKS